MSNVAVYGVQDGKPAVAPLLQEVRDTFEAIRRKAHQFDKNTSFYETFDTEFGTVISELYALHSDYITTKEHDPLVIAWRQMWLDRAHKMLTQAHEKLRSQEQYIDSSLKLRVAHLFADLSTFMAGGARDKKGLMN